MEVFNESYYSQNYEDFLYDSYDDDDDDEDDYDDDSFTRDRNDDNIQPFQKLLNMLQNVKCNETIQQTFIVNEIEVMLAVLKFSEKYSLPNSAVVDPWKMINSFVDIPIIPDTRYRIEKTFNSGEGIHYHAVCPNCKMYINKFTRKDRKITCNICNNNVSLKDPLYRDFFVTLDVSRVIETLIEGNSEYYDKIVSQKVQSERTSFEDICDGDMYRKFVNSLPNEDKKRYCTVTFNSDGSPTFKSSTCSVWPIQLIVNEVPVHVRQQRPIKFAFWFGKDKPNMRIFLTPFVQRINDLAVNGIPCQINNDVRHVKVFAICCCVDTVARAPMQNFVLFNGYFGCGWCLHTRVSIFHKKGYAMKYILLDEMPELRNERNTIQYIQEALICQAPVCGVKGASPLLNLKSFNIINGFVPDPMHCIAMGVVKQITNYWIESSGEIYSISKPEIVKIDNYVKSFKVPNQIARL